MSVRLAEFDAVVAGVAGALARARARLQRREDALLAALHRGGPISLRAPDGGAMMVSPLELVSLRPQQIVDLTLELPCRVIEVVTEQGRRLAVRPRPIGAAHTLRVRCSGAPTVHAALAFDGQPLRAAAVEATGEPPSAHAYLLAAADAVRVRALHRGPIAVVDLVARAPRPASGAVDDELWLWLDADG